MAHDHHALYAVNGVAPWGNWRPRCGPDDDIVVKCHTPLERPLIAVVDDDGGVRRAMSRLVRGHGLDVATYSSGEALLDALSESAPTCVLLDINLPGLVGLQILRHLALAGGLVPAIIMTGFDRPGLREQCLAAGAAGFLTKPVGAAELTTALDPVLRSIARE